MLQKLYFYLSSQEEKYENYLLQFQSSFKALSQVEKFRQLNFTEFFGDLVISTM